jgi:hypothetical protein
VVIGTLLPFIPAIPLVTTDKEFLHKLSLTVISAVPVIVTSSAVSCAAYSSAYTAPTKSPDSNNAESTVTSIGSPSIVA